jgi:hypothetical protein
LDDLFVTSRGINNEIEGWPTTDMEEVGAGIVEKWKGTQG